MWWENTKSKDVNAEKIFSVNIGNIRVHYSTFFSKAGLKER